MLFNPQRGRKKADCFCCGSNGRSNPTASAEKVFVQRRSHLSGNECRREKQISAQEEQRKMCSK